MQSEILGKQIVLSVSLPESYDKGNKKYPVLFVLTTSMSFEHDVAIAKMYSMLGEIPELIVIGLPRFETGYIPFTKDMTPKAESMGANLLIKFMG